MHNVHGHRFNRLINWGELLAPPINADWASDIHMQYSPMYQEDIVPTSILLA